MNGLHIGRWAAMLVTIAVTTGLAACGSDDESASETTTTAAVESSTSTSLAPKPWPTNVPAAVQQRPSLPDCGQYDATAYGARGIGKLPPVEQLKLDCFWKAYESGGSAELRATAVVSIEGEVRSLYFRTLGAGKHEAIQLNADGTSATYSCKAFGKEDPLVPTCSTT